MQNSDSGTKLNPGDRVRVRHRPELDGAYSKAGRASRVAGHAHPSDHHSGRP